MASAAGTTLGPRLELCHEGARGLVAGAAASTGQLADVPDEININFYGKKRPKAQCHVVSVIILSCGCARNVATSHSHDVQIQPL